MKGELQRYKEAVGGYYNSLSVADQTRLRVRLAQVSLVGTATLGCLLIYWAIPLEVRVFALPMIIAVALLAGSQIDAIIKFVRGMLGNMPTFAAFGVMLAVAFLVVGLLWGIRQ